MAIAITTAASTFGQNGFAYQAVIRNAEGQLITNKQVDVKFTLLHDGSEYYVEKQSVTTNEYGNIQVVVGEGTKVDGDYANVPWNTLDIDMKIEVSVDKGAFVELGTTKVQASPYAIYAQKAGGYTAVNSASKSGDALFSVNDANGNPVFAVFADGIVVYVDDSDAAKAKRSGFVVTGRSATKDKPATDYFSVTAEGTQIYVGGDTSKAKRSGFVVTGRSATKDGEAADYLTVDGEGTTVFADDDTSKAKRSGFVVKGRSATKDGETADYFAATTDGTTVYVDPDSYRDSSKAKRSGFVVKGRSATKDGEADNFLAVDGEGTQVYVDGADSEKAKRSGFVVTGRSATKDDEKLFAIEGGYTRVYIDDTDAEKAKRSGFVVTGRSATKDEEGPVDYFAMDGETVEIVTNEMNVTDVAEAVAVEDTASEQPVPEQPRKSLFSISSGNVQVATEIILAGEVAKKIEADTISFDSIDVEFPVIAKIVDRADTVSCSAYKPFIYGDDSDAEGYSLLGIYSKGNLAKVTAIDANNNTVLLIDASGNVTKKTRNATVAVLMPEGDSVLYIRPLRATSQTINFGLMKKNATEPYQYINITAEIEAEDGVPYNVKYNSNNSNGGYVTMTESPVYGEKVTFEAVANEGFMFVGWSDGSTQASHTVTIIDDFEITAEFDVLQYIVTAKPNRGSYGTVEGAGTFSYGQEAFIEAIANPGYYFSNWSGIELDEEEQTKPSIVLTVTENLRLIAYFGKLEFAPFNDEPAALPGVVEAEDFDYGKDAYYNQADGTSWNVSPDVQPYTYNIAYREYEGNYIGIDSIFAGEYALSFTDQGDWCNYTVKVDSAQSMRWAVRYANYSNRNAKISVTRGKSAVIESVSTPTTQGWWTYRMISGVTKDSLPVGIYKLKLNFTQAACNVDKIMFGKADDALLSIDIKPDENTTPHGWLPMGTVKGYGFYAKGTTVTVTATADKGYYFAGWSDGVASATREIKLTEDVHIDALFKEAAEVHSSYYIGTWADRITNEWFVDASYNNYGVNENDEAYYMFDAPGQNPWSAQFCAIFKNLPNQEVGKEFSLEFEAKWIPLYDTVKRNAASIQMVTGKMLYYNEDSCYQWTENNTELVNAEGKFDESVRSIVTNVGRDWTTINWNGYIGNYGANEETDEESPYYGKGGVVGIQMNMIDTNKLVTDGNSGTFYFRNIVVKMGGEVVAEYYKYRPTFNVYCEAIKGEGTFEGAGERERNKDAIIKAVPADGYKFVRWQDGATNPERSYYVYHDIYCRAIFCEENLGIYDLELSAEGYDNPDLWGSGRYYEGEEVEIYAEPSSYFEKWSDGNTESRRWLTIAAPAEGNTIKLTAQFNVPQSCTEFIRLTTPEASPEITYVIGNDGKQYTSDDPYQNNIWVTEHYHCYGETELTASGLKIPIPEDAQNSWDVQFCNILEGLENMQEKTFKLSFDIKWVSATDAEETIIMLWTGKNESSDEYSQFENNTELVTYGEIYDQETGKYIIDTIPYAASFTGESYYVFNNEWTNVSFEAFVGYKGRVGLQLNLVNGNRSYGTYYISNVVIEIDGNVVSNCFAPSKTVTISANVNAIGEGIGGDIIMDGFKQNIGTYDRDEKVVLTASPNAESQFVRWSDGYIYPERTLVADDNYEFEALFCSKSVGVYDVTLTADGRSDAQLTGAGRYYAGETVTVSAKPIDNFEKWTDGSTESTDNPYTFTVSQNTMLTAMYAKPTITVVNSGDAGSVTILINGETPKPYATDNDGSYYYWNEGDAVELIATPNEAEGYYFAGWKNNLSSLFYYDGNSYTVEADFQQPQTVILKHGEVANVPLESYVRYNFVGAEDLEDGDDMQDLRNLMDYWNNGGYIFGPSTVDLSASSKISTFHWELRFDNSITSIVLPPNLSYFNTQVFEGTSIVSVTIPENSPYLTIEDDVLYNKEKTKMIWYPPYKSGSEFTLPGTVTSLTYGAFQNNQNLVTIKGLDQITEMEEMSVFYGCQNLKEVSLTSLQGLTLPGYTFQHSSSLEKVTLSASIVEILYDVFNDCPNLTEVHFRSTTPPILNNGNGHALFEGCNENLTFYVPIGSKQKYLDDIEYFNNPEYNAFADEVVYGSLADRIVEEEVPVETTSAKVYIRTNVPATEGIPFTDDSGILQIENDGVAEEITEPDGTYYQYTYNCKVGDYIRLRATSSRTFNGWWDADGKLVSGTMEGGTHYSTDYNFTVENESHTFTAKFYVPVTVKVKACENGTVSVYNIAYSDGGGEVKTEISTLGLDDKGEYYIYEITPRTTYRLEAEPDEGYYFATWGSQNSTEYTPYWGTFTYAPVFSPNQVVTLERGKVGEITVENGVGYNFVAAADFDNDDMDEFANLLNPYYNGWIEFGKSTIDLSAAVNVTEINSMIFNKITSIVLPPNVTIINDQAFQELQQLKLISISPDNQNYTTEEGVLYNKAKTSLVCYPSNKSGDEFTLPETVTSLKYAAFIYNQNLEKINGRDQITEMNDDDVFYGCQNLKEVSLTGLTTGSLPAYTFEYSAALEKITLSPNVKSIGYDAFNSCPNLVEIHFRTATPPTLANHINTGNYLKLFEECNANLKFYVPKDCVNNYLNDADNFANADKNAFAGDNLVNCIAADEYEVVTSATIQIMTKGLVSVYDGMGNSINISQTVQSGDDFIYTYNCTVGDRVTLSADNTSTTVVFSGWFGNFTKEFSQLGDDDYALSNCLAYENHGYVEYITSYQFDVSAETNRFVARYVEPEPQFTYKYDATNPTWASITGYTGYRTNLEIPAKTTIDGVEYPVTSIGREVFAHNSYLQSVTFAEGCQLDTIYSNAFWNCSNLASITIPATVVTIEEMVFWNCTSLKEIGVASSNSVYTSSDGVLFNNDKTILICCPPGKEGAYSVPNSVQYIATRAFWSCSNLTSVSIHNSVENIGEFAFWGCSSMTEINVGGDNANYSSEDGVLFDKEKETLICCPAGNSGDEGAYTIPNSVKTIYTNAFDGCKNLTSVDFSHATDLTSIGGWAFQDCSNLTSLSIPESVTEMGGCVFAGCSSLQSANIPNGVCFINTNIISGCNSLTYLSFDTESDWFFDPECTNPIGQDQYMEDDQFSLSKFMVLNASTPMYKKAGNTGTETGFQYRLYKFNGSNYASITGYNGSDVDIEIPATVVIDEVEYTITSIADEAFKANANLHSVTFAESSQVDSIGANAFYWCESLDTITLSNMTYIGGSAFYGCNSLRVVNIPSDVQLGANSFNACSKATIFVPENWIAEDYNNLFDDVKLVVFSGSPASTSLWGASKIAKQDTVHVAYNSVLSREGTTLLAYIGSESYVEMLEGVLTIGEKAFYNCSEIENLVISNYVSTIKADAFGNTSMAITMPSSITKIEQYAFRDGNVTFTNFDPTNWYSNPLFTSDSRIASSTFMTDEEIDASKIISYTNDNAMWRSDGFEYVFDETNLTATLTAYDGSKTELKIPATVTRQNVYYVTAIGENVFANNTDIKKVSIPYTVKNIGENAFSGCSSLEEANYVNKYDFEEEGDDSWDFVVIQAGNEALTNIKPQAGTGFTFVTNEANQTATITAYNGTGTEVEFPVSVAKNGKKYIVKSIGDGTNPVLGQGGVTSVTFAKGSQVKTIADYAFSSCDGLQSVVLSDYVTSIGDAAFKNCDNLQTISIPVSLTTVYGSAFSGCTSLETVYYPGFGSQMKAGITIQSNNNYFDDDSKWIYTGVPLSAAEVADHISQLSDSETIYVSGELDAYFEDIKTAINGLSEGVFVSLDLSGASFSDGELPGSAFSFCKNIERIVLPEGITTIPYETFWLCENLRSFNIPSTVETIDGSAFYRCKSLDTVYLSNSSEYFAMEDGVIYNLDKTEIVLYTNKNKRATFTVPEDIIEICPYAFASSKITGITFESDENLETIGNTAFDCCKYLKSIVIPNSVTEIGNDAFYASGLTSVRLPNSITAIRTRCFSSCDLIEVNIPEGVKTIEYGGFYGMSSVETLSIPASLESIENGAFNYWTGIKSVSVAEGSHYFKTQNNMLLSMNNDTLLLCYDRQEITSVEVPSGVTKIFDHVFRECNNLKTLTLPASLESIGSEIIDGCYKFETVYFAGSERQKDNLLNTYGIGQLESVPWVCSGGTSQSLFNFSYDEDNHTATITGYTGSEADVDIPSSINYNGSKYTVTAIGDNAFENNMVIHSVYLPSTIETIGVSAFSVCTELVVVKIPNSVTSIGDYAFQSCYKLVAVNIPNSVTSIGRYAFYNCMALSGMFIPNSVSVIGEDAFTSMDLFCEVEESEKPDGWDEHFSNWCYDTKWGVSEMPEYGYSITSDTDESRTVKYGPYYGSASDVEIPESIEIDGNWYAVTSIHDDLFKRNSIIKSVRLANGITCLPSGSFYMCTNLESINIPDSLQSIVSGALSYCDAITSISVDYYHKWFKTEYNMLLSKGNDTLVLCYNKQSLEEVALPNGLTKIFKYAFKNCPNLTSVTLPSSLKTIELHAFGDSDNLTYMNFDTESNWYSDSSCDDASLIEKSDYMDDDIFSISKFFSLNALKSMYRK